MGLVQTKGRHVVLMNAQLPLIMLTGLNKA